MSLFYLGLIAALGFAVALQGRNRSLAEYFLAGKGTGPVVLALSLGITTLGAIGAILLINPDIHSQGPALLALAVLSSLLVLLGTLVGRKYDVARVMTTSGIVGQRFGRLPGTLVAGVFALLIVIVRLPMVLLGGSWVLSELSGWEPLTTAMLILVVAGLYTTAGGFPSVQITQAMQGIVVVLAALGLLGLSLTGQTLVVDLPFGSGPELTFVPFVLLVLSLVIVGIWYFWTDQSVVQQVCSARTPVERRRGVLMALAFVSITALLGLNIAGAGAPPESLPSVSQLPGMAASLLVLSLTLAVVAGMLQSAAAMITIDIVRPYASRSTELSLVLVARLSTTGVAVIVLLLVSALGPATPASLARFLEAHLVVAPPTAALFLGVLFLRRVSAAGAAAAMLAGIVLGIGFLWLPPSWNLPAVTFAVVSFGVSLAMLLGFSYLSRAPGHEEGHEVAGAPVDHRQPDVVATR